MLQILHATNIPFMKYRRIAYFFSGAILAATLAWLAVKGPRKGIDFRGGTQIEFLTSQPVSADVARGALDRAGYKGVDIQQTTGKALDGSPQYSILIRVLTDTTEARTAAEHMGTAIQQAAPGTQVTLHGD